MGLKAHLLAALHLQTSPFAGYEASPVAEGEQTGGDGLRIGSELSSPAAATALLNCLKLSEVGICEAVESSSLVTAPVEGS